MPLQNHHLPNLGLFYLCQMFIKRFASFHKKVIPIQKKASVLIIIITGCCWHNILMRVTWGHKVVSFGRKWGWLNLPFDSNFPLFQKTWLFDPGQLQGLKLILSSSENDMTAVPRQNSGFKILLHRHDEIPYNLQDFGVELDLGKHTSVRIEPREVDEIFIHISCVCCF